MGDRGSEGRSGGPTWLGGGAKSCVRATLVVLATTDAPKSAPSKSRLRLGIIMLSRLGAESALGL
jgi:hypothetical protein